MALLLCFICLPYVCLSVCLVCLYLSVGVCVSLFTLHSLFSSFSLCVSQDGMQFTIFSTIRPAYVFPPNAHVRIKSNFLYIQSFYHSTTSGSYSAFHPPKTKPHIPLPNPYVLLSLQLLLFIPLPIATSHTLGSHFSTPHLPRPSWEYRRH